MDMLREVMDRTTITLPAIARKVGVSLEEMTSWADGSAEPTGCGWDAFLQFAAAVKKDRGHIPIE